MGGMSTPEFNAWLSLLACERVLGRIHAVDYDRSTGKIRVYGKESPPQCLGVYGDRVRFEAEQDYIEITPMGDGNIERQFDLMNQILAGLPRPGSA